jgi:hypothetical protein
MKQKIWIILMIILPLHAFSQTADDILRRFEQATNHNRLNNFNTVVRKSEAIVKMGLVRSKGTTYDFFRQSEYRSYNYSRALGMQINTTEMYLNGIGLEYNNRWDRIASIKEAGLANRAQQRGILNLNADDMQMQYSGEKDGSYVITFTQGKNRSLLYFDKRTYYITKVESLVYYLDYATNSEKSIESNFAYSDYKSFNGIYLPTKANSIGGSMKMEVKYTDYWFDVELPDALFEPDDENPMSGLLDEKMVVDIIKNGNMAIQRVVSQPTTSVSQPTATAAQPSSGISSGSESSRRASQNESLSSPARVNTPAAPRRFFVYASLGMGFPIVSSNYGGVGPEGFEPQAFHDMAILVKAGGLLYLQPNSNPKGFYLNGGISYFQTNNLNLTYYHTETGYQGGSTWYDYTIINTSGSMTNLGFSLSVGYTIPLFSKVGISPYLGINPSISGVTTNGDEFESSFETSLNTSYTYRNSTLVDGIGVSLMPEFGLRINIGAFFINPSIVLTPVKYNMNVESKDFDSDGYLFGEEKEYQHDFSFRSTPFIVSLGFRF